MQYISSNGNDIQKATDRNQSVQANRPLRKGKRMMSSIAALSYLSVTTETSRALRRNPRLHREEVMRSTVRLRLLRVGLRW